MSALEVECLMGPDLAALPIQMLALQHCAMKLQHRPSQLADAKTGRSC